MSLNTCLNCFSSLIKVFRDIRKNRFKKDKWIQSTYCGRFREQSLHFQWLREAPVSGHFVSGMTFHIQKKYKFFWEERWNLIKNCLNQFLISLDVLTNCSVVLCFYRHFSFFLTDLFNGHVSCFFSDFLSHQLSCQPYWKVMT
jgi:hypothetical protein